MGLTSADNAYMASTEPEPECDPGEGPQASGEGDGDVEASTNPSSTVHAANQSQIHAPSDGDLLEAAEYVNTVPTRWMGHKIRHQVKQRAARKVQALLELPGVLNRLRTLYTRHPIYVGPRVDHDHVLEEVGLPEEVLQITESFNPKGIRFKDIGHYDMFKCYGDCFMDTCENVASAVYCRVGIKLFTNTDLGVGDVVGDPQVFFVRMMVFKKGNPTRNSNRTYQQSGNMQIAAPGSLESQRLSSQPRSTTTAFALVCSTSTFASVHQHVPPSVVYVLPGAQRVHNVHASPNAMQ
ncbi:hypothetical protein PC110_g15341 [Phytophthora cactorum]|uniref:Uncharacterized protein n=1 Tax=Phytophthora cactorum TaxID=29920 RepID=A0A329RXW5_9STRA|nr:hypothetical protein PC110_g15341 [Phytophthora cactorum]